MKKIILYVLIVFFTAGCGVTIKTTADSQLINAPYKNIVIIIPYDNLSSNFVKMLKNNLNEQFKKDQKEVEIFLFEKSDDDLKLNANLDINNTINGIINDVKKDVILIFKPTNFYIYNNMLKSATYEITAIDIKSKLEVWKAKFKSDSSFGPSVFAKKCAEVIISKLKEDKMI